MKKLIIVTTVACMAVMSHASAVKWQATATSAYNGQTMYLLTSISTTYDDLSAFTSKAVDSAAVAKVGPSYKVSLRTAENDAITASSSFYLAVIDASDSTKIHYKDVTTTMQGLVYTPPDSAPDTFSIAFADVATATTTATIGGGGGGDVPEPTSALLMLFGAAGLALRRRRR